MLFKRTLIREKFNKSKKFKLRGLVKKKRKTIGKFCIIALQTAVISERQLESFYNTLLKKLRKISSKSQTKVWFRTFPVKNTTSKPKEVRMGGGRGKLNEKVHLVKAGHILCEFDNVALENQLKDPQEILKGVLSKLSIRVRVF